jgi:predicted ArsR family transcriptional regulator
VDDGDFVAQVGGVGALAEPARRTLYLYVVGQPEPVSRDQAAAGVGLARHTAKFHLDKLVAEGLLSTEFRRLSGRSGPGAGRPTKLYRRADRQFAVTLPERHYDLAGQILAAAIEAAARSGIPVIEAVQEAAAVAGRRIGSACGTSVRSLDDVARVLIGHGYEPRVEGAAVLLANCPFHALARDHTALVCGMNLHLLGALLDVLGGTDVHARLEPAPQRCCVVVGTGPPPAE